MAKHIALITGGMGGLGESISTKMHDAGFNVVVTHSPGNKNAAAWVADYKGKGYSFAAYGVDVADYNSCQTCVAKVQSEVGPVDILINNAGITRDMTFKKMTKADWDIVIHTNLDSAFNMTKQVCDGMVERGWGRSIARNAIPKAGRGCPALRSASLKQQGRSPGSAEVAVTVRHCRESINETVNREQPSGRKAFGDGRRRRGCWRASGAVCACVTRWREVAG